MKRFLAIAALLAFVVPFAFMACVVDGGGSVTIEWKYRLNVGTITGSVAAADGSAISDATITVYEAEYEGGAYVLGSEYTDSTNDEEVTYSVSYADGTYTIEDIVWGDYFIKVEAENYVTYTIFVSTYFSADGESYTVSTNIAMEEQIKGLKIIATWENSGDYDMYFSFPATDQQDNMNDYASAYFPDAFYGGHQAPDVLGFYGAAETALASSCLYEDSASFTRGVVGPDMTSYKTSTAYPINVCDPSDAGYDESTYGDPVTSLTYDNSTSGKAVLDIMGVTCNSENWWTGTESNGDTRYFGLGLLTLVENISDGANSTISEANITINVFNSEGLLTTFAAPKVLQASADVPFKNWRVMEVKIFGKYDTSYSGEEYRERVDLIPYGMDNTDLLRGQDPITVDLGGRGAR